MASPRAIRVLPPDLQNQIAAGEVVERPSSVVKELIENSLDAGASFLKVRIDEGGIRLISVIDDGHGIPPQELALAVTRHATSKINSLADLSRIQSLGFRGEALPSIASVSHFRLTSKIESILEAASIEVRFGSVGEQAPAVLAKGTRVEVRDLFSNVPARLKFLKTPSTETRRCQDIFERIGLAHLDVDMEFCVGERSRLRFFKDQNLRQRLELIWPPDITNSLLAVNYDRQGSSVSGLIGLPSMAQPRPDRIYFYVNGRPVSDRILLRSLREAFKGQLLSREYPQAVLFLTVAPEEVDVNVHPAKNEVRFRDESQVFSLVLGAVKNALGQAAPEHEPIFGRPEDYSRIMVMDPIKSLNLPIHEPSARYGSATPHSKPVESSASPVPFIPKTPTHAAEESSLRLGDLTYLGQFHETYLVLTRGRDELWLVDQHAAHERILFAKRRRLNEAGSRPLAVPLELPLHASQVSTLESRWQELLDLGFSLSLSPQRLIISAVPGVLTPGQAKEFLSEVASNRADSLDDLWAMLSCRAAVKAGDVLAPDEALSLLAQWLDCPERDYCPHGRPIVLRWSASDLERLFKRAR